MTTEFNLSNFLVKTEGNKGYYVCEEKLKEFIRLIDKLSEMRLYRSKSCQMLIRQIKKYTGSELSK